MIAVGHEPRYFRLRLVMSLFDMPVEGPGVNVTVPGDVPVDVEIRDGRPTPFAAATLTRRANDRVQGILDALLEKKDHPDVEHESIDRHPEDWPEQGIRAVAPRAFPEYFLDWADEAHSILSQAIELVLGISRWRFSSDAPHHPQRRRVIEWTEDGNEWTQLPTSTRGDARFVRPMATEADSTATIQDMIDAGLREPIAHSLFREAYAQRFTNRRSSLVLAVAAAEVSVKSCVALLVPDAEWLLEQLPSPPIERILQDYLPTLSADSARATETRWPPGLIDAIRKAVGIRNTLVHTGKGEPSPEVLREILTSIGELLTRCDRLAGYSWSENYAARSSRMSDA